MTKEKLVTIVYNGASGDEAETAFGKTKVGAEFEVDERSARSFLLSGNFDVKDEKKKKSKK